jgi:GNAT superfamily N-acetyltransferase
VIKYQRGFAPHQRLEETAMIVRPVELTDLNACLALEHSYVTNYVWQMEESEEAGKVTVVFRTARLPRSMRVKYPKDYDNLLESWQQGECFLVAEEDGEVYGYLDMSVQSWHLTGWVDHLAVAKSYRRQGIGTALLKKAAEWSRQRGLKRLMLEIQTKNYPAICFCQKNGFAFCGFNDRYYTNQDIALFFARNI